MWPEKYPIASQGKRQSPIDIRTSECEECSPRRLPAGRALEMEYPSQMDNLTLVNGGHGWRVDVPPEIAQKTRKLILIPYYLVPFPLPGRPELLILPERVVSVSAGHYFNVP